MKNRRTFPPWIFLGILILMLSISACRPTKSATEGMTPSPTEDAISAQNTPTPLPPTDGNTSEEGATDETTTGDGTTDSNTIGDGATDGSTTGEGTTDGATDGSSSGDGGTAPAGNTPTPTPAPVDTGTGSSGPTTHVVQAGETVYSISVRYGVSVDAIAAANNLGPHYTIYVGQTLAIPGDDGTVPPTAEPPPGGCRTTHVVQPGENLFRIGLRYGHTVDELAAANPEIVNPNNIKVGQLICIP